MTAANTKTATNGCTAGTGKDTIRFSVTGTIHLANTLPQVTDGRLTINGPASPGIMIDGGNNLAAYARPRYIPYVGFCSVTARSPIYTARTHGEIEGREIAWKRTFHSLPRDWSKPSLSDAARTRGRRIQL